MKSSTSRNDNPYASPTPCSNSARFDPPRNAIGTAGFWISLASILGLVSVNELTGDFISTVGMWVTFLCLPGAAISIIGLLWQPRHLAAWGAALGAFGSLYLPTIYMSLFLQ